MFRRILLGLAASCLAGSATYADTITAGGASWIVFNTMGTSNGLPAGGSSNGGPGFGVSDATFLATGQGDAFDNGLILFINNQIFSAPGFTSTPTSSASGVVNQAGLNVQMRYDALATSPTLRTLIEFTNPTAAPITFDATFVTNVGSDAGTQMIATGSGDITFGTNDTYIITDDSTTGGDPANTHVLYGLGGLAPNSVSQTVFSAAGTQGVLANFNLTIGAGQTSSLLFFNRLNGTAAAATASVGDFSTLTPDLTAGLTPGQVARAVNFAPQQAVPEPATIVTGLALAAGGLVAGRRRR